MRIKSDYWVDVTLPLPLHVSFTYHLGVHSAPSDPLGYRVIVPFGDKVMIGIITKVRATPPSGGVKAVLYIPDEEPVFSRTHLAFLEWVSSYYLCPLGQVLRTALAPFKVFDKVLLRLLHPERIPDLPEGSESLLQALAEAGSLTYREAIVYMPAVGRFSLLKVLLQERVISLSFSLYPEEVELSLGDGYFASEEHSLGEGKDFKTPAQKKLRDVYLSLVQTSQQKWVATSKLLERGISPQLLTRVCKANIFMSRERPVASSALVGEPRVASLTEEQRILFEVMDSHSWQDKLVAYLQLREQRICEDLYCAFAIHTIKEGHHNLLLVPNLETLHLWEKQLRPLLGARLIVWSSYQKSVEKQRIWHALQQTPSALILGLPSVLFAPLRRFDRIIVAQESSSDYKQESAPRYHARDAAIMYAQHYHSKVLLTSITPSLETYYNVQKGKYASLSLPSLDCAHPPTPHLRVITRRRNYPLLTTAITKELQKSFSQNKQVIFLHPIRGYTTYTSCAKCHWQANCSACSTGLTYHHTTQQFHCHYCQQSYPAYTHCPECNATQLQYRRIGTQQIGENLHLLFPFVHIARVDQDATPHPKKYQETLNAFKKGQLDCLIGTQRLLRALPQLTPHLLIFTDPHQWTSHADFRAPVQQRQLLEELLHHPTAKELIILTTAHHRSLLTPLRRDQNIFYDDLLEVCSKQQYPPFLKFIKVSLRHRNQEVATQAANHFASILSSQLQLTTLGPLPTLSNPRKGYVQVALWVKLTQQKTKPKLLHLAQILTKQHLYRNIKISFDVDPAG